ncbi:hypothetical protein BANRA_03796 [Klebsiella pneumoniae]|nr:hypothetical protein BANRA_03796 [Klebsiella pneumoniae]VDA25715.1 hypothetical protein BANRA_04323 [Klebsiella pneumoniae]VDA81082.1 hypothetical protein BANRA_00874 [Klebsiella pneumoniae]
MYKITMKPSILKQNDYLIMEFIPIWKKRIEKQKR